MGEAKLPFQLVFASSEDASYPAAELNVHSPQTRGWQSARFCEYPQELGLWFPDGPVAISQVQLLSHQSKVATKIELSVGVGAGGYEDAKFTRLGYLSLDSNERSGHKVRRLPRVERRRWRRRPLA
jgi:centrosomal protein CEP104